MVNYAESTNKLTLSYNGLCDFDGMFAAVIDWAKNYGFMWHEAEYKHKVPSPKGAETEHKWILSKNVSEYVRYEINFTIHSWDLLEVEVESEGKKKPLTNIRLYIIIEGKVIYDWQKKFQKSGVAGKLLGKWYNKILERELLNHWDTLYYSTLNLHAIIKTYFDMQSKKHPFKGYLGDG